MKPVRGRGSRRTSAKTPKKRVKKTVTETQEPCCSNQDKTKLPPKKKGPGKFKVQDKWKPLSTSSIAALGKMIDHSIMSVLATQRTESAETEKQLDTLKEKFLAKCAQLPVPKEKHGDIMHLTRLLEEETQKAAVGKKILRTLKADVKSVGKTMESLEEQNVSLESTCSALRLQLEEEQLKAQEMLEQADKGELDLPVLCSYSEPTLHDCMMRMVPIADRDDVARRLDKVLHMSAPIQDVQDFLLHAHEHVDELTGGL